MFENSYPEKEKKKESPQLHKQDVVMEFENEIRICDDIKRPLISKIILEDNFFSSWNESSIDWDKIIIKILIHIQTKKFKLK